MTSVLSPYPTSSDRFSCVPIVSILLNLESVLSSASLVWGLDQEGSFSRSVVLKIHRDQVAQQHSTRRGPLVSWELKAISYFLSVAVRKLACHSPGSLLAILGSSCSQDHLIDTLLLHFVQVMTPHR